MMRGLLKFSLFTLFAVCAFAMATSAYALPSGYTQ
jgi:hypothetical protein